MTLEERACRLVGDMPWVTEHLTQEQIIDLRKQIQASMEAIMDVELADDEYIPDGHYFKDDLDGGRLVRKG